MPEFLSGSFLSDNFNRPSLKEREQHTQAHGRMFIDAADTVRDGQDPAGLVLAALSGHPLAAQQGPAATTSGSDHAIDALVADFPARGAGALEKLTGPFAAALYDRRTGALTLAVDRAGMAELFWTRRPDGTILFSQDCAALARAPGVAADIDPVSIYNYLFFYCIPAPRTIYRGIEKLMPGEAVTFSGAGIERSRYWRMPYAQDRAKSADDWSAEIRETLADAVGRSLGRQDGRAGCFLSGGLDSSTVAGMAAQSRPGIDSFTIRFREAAYDEGDYARIAAARFETTHHERYVTPEDVIPAMDALAGACGQPYGNTSIIAAYYCAMAAKDAGMSALLAGDGGDEIFAGNERYLYLQRYDVYGRIPAPLRRYLLDPLLAPAGVDRLPVLGKGRRLKQRFYMTLAERMFADYHPFRNFAPDDVFADDVHAGIGDHDPVDLARDSYAAAAGGDDVQRMMAVDMFLTIAANDLVKVNGACRAAGIDVRYPMLETEVMDLAARIPSDMMLRDGRLRGLFKHAMRPLLPDAILRKPKHGFGLPFQVWSASHPPLREKVCDHLHDLRSRGFFTDRYIDALQAACSGDDAFGLRGNAWDAAMLEMWFRHQESVA